MNPLHLTGHEIQILCSNPKPHAELMISDGHQGERLPERYLFRPRQIPYDSVVIENGTGHISLAALRWLSKHNIPVFLMGYDGSVISSILPPTPIKADLRAAQFQAASNPERKFNIACAFVEAKIQRSLQLLDWLGERHDIEKEIRIAKHEASKLKEASTVIQLRTVEGRTALRYWEAYRKAIPERLRFKGRTTTSHNNNATDPVNAALNYGYGFLKVECRTAINTVGLEPAVGFLHELGHEETRESLVYDLEEAFRWLVDLTVIQAFASGWLNVADFEFTRDDYLYRIEFEAKKRFLHLLKKQFNSGVQYRGRSLKWDTVIEEKTNELARYLSGRSPILSFQEPNPILARPDNRTVREAILGLSQSQAAELGIGKSTLHYLRKRADEQQPFKVYGKVMEKISQEIPE
jgi:CRISPR-associated protein Cas1